jgi:hypothetical protein
MKTYLIQRGRFENRNFKKGIDSIINLDYMGSSEFEFGAIPESLGNIRKSINEYTYLDMQVKDKIITVFCKESQKSDVKIYLDQLAVNNMKLKEHSDFDNYIDPIHLKNRTDFWWDLQNDLMFWKKNNEFETKFKTIIANKPN